MKARPRIGLILLLLAGFASFSVFAAVGETNSAGTSSLASDDYLVWFIQLVGALCVVFALLIGGAWVFRRSPLFSLYHSGPAQLKVLESRSLGYRNSLMVVGYSQHRFLLAVTASGVNLISALPDASGEPAEMKGPSFATQLNALQEKKP